MHYTVYKITNLINNKIYVGIHQTENLDDAYMGSGNLIIRAIKKYSIDNFKKEYLAIFDNPEDMFKMESKLVNGKFIQRNDTYNLKTGGNGGFSHLKGTVTIRDSNNNTRRVAIDDPRYLSGEFVPICVNEFTAIDAYMNRYRIKNDDPRYLSGELFGITKGCQQSIEAKEKRKFLASQIDMGLFRNKKHTEETKKKISIANKIKAAKSNNSQFGTVWIYNIQNKENKKIKKEDLTEWLEKGWIKGRKMRF